MANTLASSNPAPATDLYGYTHVTVLGARMHNLKNIDVSFPRNQLVVITGVSGSGKSSLAFDTIYAEGQRRYMESFAAYARNFLGSLERPDVDKINGLSPVIAIEQKTTNRNPRSTVGTVTELYDFLRLLFARIAEPYSYLSGRKMIQQSESQIQTHLLKKLLDKKIILLAPIVKGRKGHYRELFQQILKAGFSKVRVDGVIHDIVPKMQLDRYKIHDIEIVVDRLVVQKSDEARLHASLQLALMQSKGTVMVEEEGGGLHYFSQKLMDPESGLAFEDPAPNTFSFNSPYGACPTCNGLGEITEINEAALIPDPARSIGAGGIAPLGIYRPIWVFRTLETLLKQHGYSVSTPIKELPESLMKIILHGCEDKIEVNSIKHPGTTWQIRFEGVIAALKRNTSQDSGAGTEEAFLQAKVCPACQGTRLKKEALCFKIDHKNIAELASMDLFVLSQWLENLEDRLSPRHTTIAEPVLKELRKRIQLLIAIGLHYLHLNRPIQTLSGGEAQRIRLATQIGTQLVGVLYILDEPSIGLHQRDNIRLIEALQHLRDLGNTVLVVEHDKDMMLLSDYIIDIGPGAGKHGGEVVAAGSPPEFLQQRSATADFLTGQLNIEIPSHRRQDPSPSLILKGCTGHNLKDVTLCLPLGKLVCVTGVSGSGKSSLIHGTLFPILNRHFYRGSLQPLPYRAIHGLEHIDKVVEIDQAPIGRTPRSNPATYTGVFAAIRNLFVELPEAKIRGYKAGRFSFNVKGGRCETCEGAGIKLIEMDFLPSIRVECETCKGKRYNRETLEVQYRGHSIADILDMTVEHAVNFFEKYPHILRIVKTLQEVGLGYITLGQHATTLSGGEAQRIKLATELSKRDTGKTLYILDEPTTGLHFQDIQHLLNMLQRLVDRGNTVLVIEHNLDVIKVADHVIDLGPEGGAQGGTILCEGTPEAVAKNPYSHTGRFLAKELLSYI